MQCVQHFHHAEVLVWKNTARDVKSRINVYASRMRSGTRKLPSVRRAEEDAKTKKREEAASERVEQARKEKEERKRREEQKDGEVKWIGK